MARRLPKIAVLLCGSFARAAQADSLIDIHVQETSTVQAHPSFRSGPDGGNSLNHRADAAATNDVTLFVGVSPWHGGEFWFNPEIDQGFGLSDTLGVAGFTSGEAYKVGKLAPYYRSQRAFFRQTVDIGGTEESVDGDINLHKANRRSDRLVVTLGKFSVGDIFDANSVAHDPKADFFNWTLIDTGTFDYAADSWGYSAGGAAELYVGAWTVRGAVMALSNVPNGETLDLSFAQHQLIGEIEHRVQINQRPGVVRLTAFDSYGRMGRFDEALALGVATNQAPSTALVRRYAHRAGVSVNAEQSISDTLSAFFRAGVADGSKESYEFTDVDQSIAAGFSLKGTHWHRANDGVGAAFVVNDISNARQAYLAAGGLGVLVGDGSLPHKRAESIIETYYRVGLAKWAQLTFDTQLVFNPAFNADRGPVLVGGIRLHLTK